MRMLGGTALIAIGMLAACSRDPGQQPVAEVDGSAITRMDLDLAERRTLGGMPAQDPAIRRRILESLVLNRAIARHAEGGLDQRERRMVEAEVQAYREQFLARMYLARQPRAAAPSNEAVRRYYDDHAGLFGAAPDHRYEMIALGQLADADRPAARSALEATAADADWILSAAKLKSRGLAAEFRSGHSAGLAPTPQLRALVEATRPPEARTVEVEGRMYLVRVIEQRHSTPRPLDEVRAQIVEALHAVQMRNQLDSAGAVALREVDVEYFEN